MGKETTTPETTPAEAPKKAKKVTVYATGDLYENGTHLKKGDPIEVTPERAAALGEYVTATAPDA